MVAVVLSIWTQAEDVIIQFVSSAVYIAGMLSFVLGPRLSLRTKLWFLVLALRLKSLSLTLMCCGSPDTIDWPYIFPDGGRCIHIPTNKQ